MTIEEKLDLILNEIKAHYGHLPDVNNWRRICRLVTDGNGIDTGDSDYENNPLLKGFISGLRDEGFIMSLSNQPSAGRKYDVATVKGLMFEGFVNQKVRLEREREAARDLSEAQQKLSKRLDRLQSRMVLLTALVAIGTAIAAWYYGIEIWKYYHPASCH